MDEKTILFLEEHIPELADVAFKQAYWQALAEGSKVLKVENNCLVEVSPDGSPKMIKELPAQIKVTPGQKLLII